MPLSPVLAKPGRCRQPDRVARLEPRRHRKRWQDRLFRWSALHLQHRARFKTVRRSVALASEALKCFRMDLQQGCRLARIEESLEMRGRLAAWCCFVHLAHKTLTALLSTVYGIPRDLPLYVKEPAPGKKY